MEGDRERGLRERRKKKRVRERKTLINGEKNMEFFGWENNNNDNKTINKDGDTNK